MKYKSLRCVQYLSTFLLQTLFKYMFTTKTQFKLFSPGVRHSSFIMSCLSCPNSCSSSLIICSFCLIRTSSSYILFLFYFIRYSSFLISCSSWANQLINLSQTCPSFFTWYRYHIRFAYSAAQCLIVHLVSIKNKLFIMTNQLFLVTNQLFILTNQLLIMTNQLFILTNKLFYREYSAVCHDLSAVFHEKSAFFNE